MSLPPETFIFCQDYAKEREDQHRRKIVLPGDIPWEFRGSSVSQKGTGGFGKIRNATLKIHSSKPLSESNDGVVPWHNCPALKGKAATQAGLTPFGMFREHVQKVQETEDSEKKKINEMLTDPKATERTLKLWARPNSEAKNNELYGKRRNAVTHSVGGRRFTQEELIKSRAALPRFQNVNETSAGRDVRPGEGLVTGYQPHRQVTMSINGLDRTEQDQLDSNRYMAWLGGQLTMQSQSRTGGFQSPRDVAHLSYYHKLMAEREMSAEELYQLRQEKKRNLEKSKENPSVESDQIEDND
uniref:Uncharacterized protein n=1 Tax=Acrobeloides nanus TaxID=290746 RepID=A0A914CPW2_9BILA